MKNQNFNENLINSDFSRRIMCLRFILAVLVVFIHSKFDQSQIDFADGSMQITFPLYVNIVQMIFTDVLGGVAVPLFFVISAYLFFAKPKSAKENVKSKFKSIAVPYIFWTVLTIFLYFAAQSFSFSRNYFSKPENIIRSWHFSDFAQAFFARKTSYLDYWHPLVYQFWYLRNLLIFMIFSPLIKFFAGRFPLSYFCAVLAAALLRMGDVFPDPLWIFPALFYFSLGFYAVSHIQKILDFLDSVRWKDFAFAYILFAAVSMFLSFTENPISAAVTFMRTNFTILLFVKIAGNFSKNEAVFKKLSALSSYSFWIYAAHAPFVVTSIKKLISRAVPMHGIIILVQFFATAFLCTTFLMIFGFLLKKFLPGIFTFTTGERKKISLPLRATTTTRKFGQEA